MGLSLVGQLSRAFKDACKNDEKSQLFRTEGLLVHATASRERCQWWVNDDSQRQYKLVISLPHSNAHAGKWLRVCLDNVSNIPLTTLTEFCRDEQFYQKKHRPF